MLAVWEQDPNKLTISEPKELSCVFLVSRTTELLLVIRTEVVALCGGREKKILVLFQSQEQRHRQEHKESRDDIQARSNFSFHPKGRPDFLSQFLLKTLNLTW